jgi:hypothetical protein
VTWRRRGKRRASPESPSTSLGLRIGVSLHSGCMARYRELLAVGRSFRLFRVHRRRGGSPSAAMVHEDHPETCDPLGPMAHHGTLIGIQSGRARTGGALDDGTASRYTSIESTVLLLGGAKRRPFITTRLFEALQGAISESFSGDARRSRSLRTRPGGTGGRRRPHAGAPPPTRLSCTSRRPDARHPHRWHGIGHSSNFVSRLGLEMRLKCS